MHLLRGEYLVKCMDVVLRKSVFRCCLGLYCCVTLDKSPEYSVPSFPLYKREIIKGPTQGVGETVK